MFLDQPIFFFVVWVGFELTQSIGSRRNNSYTI